MPKERSRSAGVFWLVGLRFVVLALQLISLKVAIQILGDKAYGVAIFVANVRAIWQFVDLDIPQGLNQILARTFRVDEEKAWNFFRTGLFLHLVIGLLGLIGMAIGPTYLTLDKSWRDVPDLQLICFVAGIQFFFDVYGSAFNAPFNAREQFHKLASLTSVIPAFTIGLQIILVIIMRSPLAVLIGTMADSALQFAVKLGYIILKERNFPIRPRINFSEAKEIISMGLRSYIAGLSTRIGGTADKIIVEKTLGQEFLTIYNLACRIPQILLEAFGKIAESFTPEMTHVSANEPQKLADIFRRNFRFLGFVAAVGIIFVGGFGDVILRAWMNRSYDSFGLLVFLMAIYYGLELHHSTITRVFFAQGKAHLMLPFTLWNSLVTLGATKFLATRFGLVGAASMNCFIDVAQIIPIHYYCSRFGVKELTLGELLKITFSVIGTGVLAGLIMLMALSKFDLSRGTSVVVVLCILPLCLALSVLYQRMGLMVLPTGLENLFRKNRILKSLFRIGDVTVS